MNQRWRTRRESYRPADEPIDTRRYEVAEIATDSVARAFVERHHYSGTYPAARFRYGLYHQAELVGVAVFSHPCNDAVLLNALPGLTHATDAAELGRFVLLDDVPGNGESWFIARCFERLRNEGLAGIVSFSDPVPRLTIEGHVVHPGHVGTIYQATNGIYRARSRARTLLILPDGTVLSERAVQKLKHGERGWQYTAALLEQHGAAPLEGDARTWARHWIKRLCRPLRHPGNHRYVWGFSRAIKRQLTPLGPYPKLHAKEPCHNADK